MISVLVLTKNEETNIEACIRSVAWSNDVVVFDSFSDDRTVEIASGLGARVFQRKFDNYGAQRAASLQLPFRNEWVLVLDADERPDEKLVHELSEIAQHGSEFVAFRTRRKDHFLGQWIRHCTLYPSWFVRFFRPNCVRYESRGVHEYPQVLGETGRLDGHLLHFSFNNGIEAWYHKHVRYAMLEAQENIASLDRGQGDTRGIFAFSDPVRRRRAIKEMSFRMPFRSMLRFLYMYIWRRGFLDGRAGLHYCVMLAIYEQMIVHNIYFLRHESASTE